MKKLLLIALLIAVLTGCNEKTMNNELKPFNIRKEFADDYIKILSKLQ
ncbi:MAG: lipoprotein [bacterium]